MSTEKMSTEKQLTANKSNAQASTGPRTEQGKQRSSLNALKSGLTGRTVLLPGEDAEAYRLHCQRFLNYHQPATLEEQELVQSLADTRWRLERCSALEHNLYALGQVEFAALYQDEPAEIRAALLQAHTFRAYQKELKNLHLQEARLERRYTREKAELDALLHQRWEHEDRQAEQLREAAAHYQAATAAGQPFHPTQLGFEFSLQQIKDYLANHPLPNPQPGPHREAA